jgi:hypothetical protein
MFPIKLLISTNRKMRRLLRSKPQSQKAKNQKKAKKLEREAKRMRFRSSSMSILLSVQLKQL